jgi:hypothetical protein
MANYRFMNASNVEYDKPAAGTKDEYTVTFVEGDLFTMYRHGERYVVQHENAPDLKFLFTLKEGSALHNMSEELLSVEVDPDNPPYMLFKPSFDIVPMLYDYFNRTYFNDECPVVKFRKTTKSTVWGMAQLEFVRKKPVYTFFVNESSMIDRVLFTNTVLHEQIHLRNFAKGYKLMNIDPSSSKDYLHDDHGPLFQDEMRRLNAKGFHILLAATHEEFKRDASEEFYAIVALETQSGRVISWNAWYTDKLLNEDDTERLAAQLKDLNPHAEYTIKLIKTKDRNVTHANHIKSTKTFTDSTLKKKIAGDIDLKNAELLHTVYLRPSIHVELPDYKDVPDLYALPLDGFYRAMRSYTDDRMVLRAKWMKFPGKLLSSQIDKKFSTLIGRMGRNAIHDDDIVNNLNDIRAAYADRFSYQQYVDAMNAFIKKYDRKGLLAEYAKIMRLIA